MASGRKCDEGRRREMARLRARGLSLAEIGRRLGVSKQCVQSTLALVARRARSLARGELPAVPCAGCGAPIASPGAIRSDAGRALCLACLARCPEAPFAQRLKSLRLAAGLTKAELADRAGLARVQVQQYEKGVNVPRRPILGRLEGVLGPRLARGQQAG
jgi:transcriptional regulator with XRE-family HTH domain